MMRKYIYAALMAASTLLLVQSCKKSGGDKSEDSFDRKGMLTNISANIILPAYTSFQTAAVNLDAAVSAFNASPDADKLSALQSAFKTAYAQWQATSTFEFGPAETVALRVNVNTWPTNVSTINANISSGTYDPTAISNLQAKGLPALDYLLFGTGADNNAVLQQYTTDGLAANRKAYLSKLSAELKTLAATVLTGWSNYKDTFVNSGGVDAGSSTSLLVNQLVYDYEILKNNEIGIPAGLQSKGAALPTEVQAYYSKISVQLVLLHMQAIQNIYSGKSAAGDGLGLDDYLTQVNGKDDNGTPLNGLINGQFATATAKLHTLKDPLSDQVTSDQATVTSTYTELQKLTVLLKTDMTSALHILISFEDTDGD